MPPGVPSHATLSLALLGAVALGPSCLDWSQLETGYCGDGFVGPEEACDDGNRSSGDGCGDTCQEEPALCGDGRLDPGEECDDANTLNGDACVEGCRLASCGDGQLWELEEACDDGNRKAGDGCSPTCQIESLPTGPRCGDGEPDPDEACDDGNTLNTDSCLNGCSRATCGDGLIRQGVEECDDGNANNGDTCTRGCMVCGGTEGSYFRIGNAHCYTAHDETVSEAQARSACQAEGGDLWTITSEAEGNDVSSKLSLTGLYWLGLLLSDGNTAWVSGENAKYTSFAAGQPSDPKNPCVAVMTSDQGGTWLSQACASKLGFVCERTPAFIFAETHHAYRLHTAALDMDAARERCKADGGHLATLETTTEHAFVGKSLGLAVWLDASDAAVEGSFFWATGEAVAVDAFATGQPDDQDGTQGCLLMNPADRYADEPCGEPHPFVCEFE